MATYGLITLGMGYLSCRAPSTSSSMSSVDQCSEKRSRRPSCANSPKCTLLMWIVWAHLLFVEAKSHKIARLFAQDLINAIFMNTSFALLPYHMHVFLQNCPSKYITTEQARMKCSTQNVYTINTFLSFVPNIQHVFLFKKLFIKLQRRSFEGHFF